MCIHFLSQKSVTYIRRVVDHVMLLIEVSCFSKTWISIGDRSFQSRNLKPWSCVRERSVPSR